MRQWQELIYRNKGKIYLVGGALRDELLGLPCKDYDYIVTGINFTTLKALLESTGGKVDVVGKSFGIIKFTNEGTTIDIALPRKEFSTGEKHTDFEVDFDETLPVEEDLYRRDFTINSMAKEIETGYIIDPLKGKQDLDKRILRANNIKRTFTEDPLRILRGIQFAARFNLEIERYTKIDMHYHRELIPTISVERIQEEFNKLLLSNNTEYGFELLRDIDILMFIIPELEACWKCKQGPKYHKLDVYGHIMKVVSLVPNNLVLRLSALLHDIGKPLTKELKEDGIGFRFHAHEDVSAEMAKVILERLRYPNDIIEKVCHLIKEHMIQKLETGSAVRRFIRRVGVENLDDLFVLKMADYVSDGVEPLITESIAELEDLKVRVKAELEREVPVKINNLAVNGDDVMRVLKLKQGAVVGKILAYLMEVVLDKPELNSKRSLNKIMREKFNGGIKETNEKVNSL
jgi:tRNA nucleotidyltransferase (CCA-adding enzyme)